MNIQEAIKELETDGCYECSLGCYPSAVECKNSLCKYRYAVLIAIDHLHRVEPKSPVKGEHGYSCPSCGSFICDRQTGKDKREDIVLGIDKGEFNFCDHCGKKLKWK